jgi:hypothetical protein
MLDLTFFLKPGMPISTSSIQILRITLNDIALLVTIHYLSGLLNRPGIRLRIWSPAILLIPLLVFEAFVNLRWFFHEWNLFKQTHASSPPTFRRCLYLITAFCTASSRVWRIKAARCAVSNIGICFAQAW